MCGTGRLISLILCWIFWLTINLNLSWLDKSSFSEYWWWNCCSVSGCQVLQNPDLLGQGHHISRHWAWVSWSSGKNFSVGWPVTSRSILFGMNFNSVLIKIKDLTFNVSYLNKWKQRKESRSVKAKTPHGWMI